MRNGGIEGFIFIMIIAIAILMSFADVDVEVVKKAVKVNVEKLAEKSTTTEPSSSRELEDLIVKYKHLEGKYNLAVERYRDKKQQLSEAEALLKDCSSQTDFGGTGY